MTTKAIKLNYVSIERFLKDYAQLSQGKIFIPTKTPSPVDTQLSLIISVPNIKQVLTIEGAVRKTIDPETATRLKKPAGMIVALTGDPKTSLRELNHALGSNERYRTMIGLPTKMTASKSSVFSGEKQKDSDRTQDRPVKLSLDAELKEDDTLAMEWIREAISQAERVREKETVPDIVAAPPIEKKQLTPLEQEKVKPSGEFLMDLTKAMLRSGYYSPDHPSSKTAKQGLYEALQNCLGDSKEIMITVQETRERSDILITGILDEPVNVKTLVGSGMAELFVPKLREYFKRKGLVSYAVKKSITPGHFESFVDIMSDPKADRGGENKRIGELLAKAFVEQGITEISTVFRDDLIVLEINLPWRVEMAIQRLAKDLKILPMFKNESDLVIREMKLQIIQDILRPLKHPEFLKDLIINCYIIAQHVDNLETEDIEKVIIEAFPIDSLLLTSHHIFKELNRLQEMKAEHPDNFTLERRLAGVKRILKWVLRRLMLENIRGAQRFLERLYLNKFLSFDELPPDVQYIVNTDKMAKDVRTHIHSYVNRILKTDTTGDAVTLLKLFRRVLPVYVEQGDWQVVLLFAKAVDKATKEAAFFLTAIGPELNPLTFVFKDRTDEIVAAYEKVDESQRKIIDDITSHLGADGIEILSKVLSDSEERGARKSAVDALIKKGDLTKNWVLKMLDDPGQKWYLKRNALMLLRYVGKHPEEISRARKLVRHEHPRVRDEALNVVITLKAGGAEELIFAALDDTDDKVRWRAMKALSELSSISEASVKKLLGMITKASPEDKETAGKHYRKIAQLIRALAAIKNIPNRNEVEDTILKIARKITKQRKGPFQRFKKPADADQSTVLSAAITTLGIIGTSMSASFLKKQSRGKPPESQM